MRLNVIYNEDCLVGMQRLPDNSVDLIATDPPYFRVKGEAWDRQWENGARFLEWLGELCTQWQRILKPNGSLYVFASPQMAARVEVKISEFFNPLNRIRWMKAAGWHNKCRPEDLRSFLSPWDEIIFAEHHGSDNIAKGEAGYAAKCDELRGFLFEPLRKYFQSRAKLFGITRAQINAAVGSRPSGGGMAAHYFGDTHQWELPTPKMFAALVKAFPTLFDLPYETLRAQYETLRRPFEVSAAVPFTDVWTFPTVNHYPGKHPCEKPLAMMEHIVKTSSRPGAVVLDSFIGSGTTAIACINTGRKYVGFENDTKYFRISQERIATHAERSLSLAKAA